MMARQRERESEYKAADLEKHRETVANKADVGKPLLLLTGV